MTANNLKGSFYNHQESPLIYVNDKQYIGNGNDFIEWALITYQHNDTEPVSHWTKIAQDVLAKKIYGSKTRKYATMKFDDGKTVSTVIFELFYDICPKTIENFLALCDGFKNQGDEQIGYVGCKIHRIVQGMYVQCGRIKHDIGHASKFNSEFEDESFCVKHTEVGLVGMCKRSGLKHTNESQFYITTGAPLSYLDNENVVFGRVVQGFSVIEAFSNLPTNNEQPAEQIKVTMAVAGWRQD